MAVAGVQHGNRGLGALISVSFPVQMHSGESGELVPNPMAETVCYPETSVPVLQGLRSLSVKQRNEVHDPVSASGLGMS